MTEVTMLSQLLLRSRLFISLALIVLVTSLASCSKSEPDTDKSAAVTQQILHVNNVLEPQDLDPQITTGLPEHYIQSSLFEGLVSKDPQTLEPVPAVAESWEISDDLTRYVFHIRKNMHWSNGEPITARDVVYSWKRLLMPKLASEYAYMLEAVVNARAFNKGEFTDFSSVGVKALDDYTLEVTLNRPTPYFLQMLDHNSTYLVPQKTIESFGKIDDRGTKWTRPENIVSNGPFKLQEWTPNKVIVVERNPAYWDARAVKLDEVHYYTVDNKQTEERMFRTGQIDMTLDGQILTDKIEIYQKEQPDHIRLTPFLGTYYYLFNTTRPPFDNVLVRRAFSMAIDRESITKNVVKGGRTPATAFTAPGIDGYTPRANVHFDPIMAKQLLAEAGYPDGKGFPAVSILYNTHNTHRNVATTLQQMWKEILNVDITLINQEWKVYLNSRETGDFDIARAGWLADFADPTSFLDMFVSGNGNNHTGWSNTQYDRLIQQANQTANQNERFELFQQAEQILIDESPVAPIYYEMSANLVNPRVKGVYPNALTYYPFKSVYLSDD